MIIRFSRQKGLHETGEINQPPALQRQGACTGEQMKKFTAEAWFSRSPTARRSRHDKSMSRLRRHDHVVAYDHDIGFTDGTVLHCVRRERPQLYIEDDKVRALFTSVYDGRNNGTSRSNLSPFIE